MDQTKPIVTVQLVYPADPLGTIPGGIETFIRGLIKSAPDDISFRLIGVTTDRQARPVGKWSECRLGRRTFQHFSVFAIGDPSRQPRIPATIRLLLAFPKYLWQSDFDILESHRIEPLLLYFRDKRPKTLVLHQNMDVINSKQSDIRWKYAPWLYRRLERLLLKTTSVVYAVKEDAVRYYRQRFPDIADKFHFVPTWVDTKIFFPAAMDIVQRRCERERLFGSGGDELILISVGRLDHQKNPLLMIKAFAAVHSSYPNARLVMVGDGMLRTAVVEEIRRLGLEGVIVLKGLMRNEAVAELVRLADLFVLSSAYEGMPICVLEALGSGVPVVTTDVGEVKKVVVPGINGEIDETQTPGAFAKAVITALDRIDSLRGEPCLESIKPFVPETVLAGVYENYRVLAGARQAGELNVDGEADDECY